MSPEAKTQSLAGVRKRRPCLMQKERVRPSRDLKSLDLPAAPVNYPKGAVLFVQGQAVRGVFLVSSGLVKLSICSRAGKVAIVKIAEAGELLGLHALLSGRPYDVTAEVKELAQIYFIPGLMLASFLQTNRDFLGGPARAVLETQDIDYSVIQSVMLSRTAAEKLSGLLLHWSPKHGRGQDRFQMPLTHEEIGQMIGVSRETVTRLLTKFKREQLLAITGATVTIRNRETLESLAGGN